MKYQIIATAPHLNPEAKFQSNCRTGSAWIIAQVHEALIRTIVAVVAAFQWMPAHGFESIAPAPRGPGTGRQRSRDAVVWKRWQSRRRLDKEPIQAKAIAKAKTKTTTRWRPLPLAALFCSPPVRWGLLYRFYVCCPSPPPSPPPSPSPPSPSPLLPSLRLFLLVFADILAVLFARCRQMSTWTSRLQWAAPDLNRELQIAVGSAGPQPGRRRTSPAGPHPGTSRAEWAAPDLSCQKICQKMCQKYVRKECQKECQKICQKKCQKICQKICQKSARQECQKICQ